MSCTITVRRTIAAGLVLAGAIGMSACSSPSEAAGSAASVTAASTATSTATSTGTSTATSTGTSTGALVDSGTSTSTSTSTGALADSGTSTGAGAASQPAATGADVDVPATGAGRSTAGLVQGRGSATVRASGKLAGYTCNVDAALRHGRRMPVVHSERQSVTLPFDPTQATQIDDRSGDAVYRLLAVDGGGRLHYLEASMTATPTVTHDAVLGDGFGGIRGLAAGLPGGGVKGTLAVMTRAGALQSYDLSPAAAGPTAGLILGKATPVDTPTGLTGIGTWGDNGFGVAVMTPRAITVTYLGEHGYTSKLDITGGLPAVPAKLRLVDCVKGQGTKQAVAVLQADGTGSVYAFTGRSSLVKVADVKG